MIPSVKPPAEVVEVLVAPRVKPVPVAPPSVPPPRVKPVAGALVVGAVEAAGAPRVRPPPEAALWPSVRGDGAAVEVTELLRSPARVETPEVLAWVAPRANPVITN